MARLAATLAGAATVRAQWWREVAEFAAARTPRGLGGIGVVDDSVAICRPATRVVAVLVRCPPYVVEEGIVVIGYAIGRSNPCVDSVF